MINAEVRYYKALDSLNRVNISHFPYLTLSDVEKIYYVINGWSAKGLKNFSQKAREIAVKAPSKKTEYFYQFMDENALFELFQAELPSQLERHGITSFGQLMQYIS